MGDIAYSKIAEINNFITAVAAIYGKGLDLQDALNEGWVSFLYAEKNYKNINIKGKIPFGEYAFLMVAYNMNQQRKIRNTIIRNEYPASDKLKFI